MTLPQTCALCGKTLKYNSSNELAKSLGMPLTEDTHDLCAKSEAHYGHLAKGGRCRDQFRKLSEAAWRKMGVQKKNGSRLLCYECHEIVLHNPVFSESQLEQLAKLFHGKSFEDRVVALNQAIGEGLTVLARSQPGASAPPEADASVSTAASQFPPAPPAAPGAPA